MREMGGLGRAMPLTAATWAVGVGALMGLPPLSGFFSKDGVLDAVWEHAPVAAGFLIVASAITAFYTIRATRLAFTGELRGTGHPHESPLVMTVPLVLLAIAAAGLGPISRGFAERFGGHADLSLPIAATTTLVTVLAGAFAWRLYAPDRAGDVVLGSRLGAMWRWAEAAYGVDMRAMQLAGWVRGACSWLVEHVDRGVIDRAVRGLGSMTAWIGARANALQTGEAPLYAAYVGVGVVLLVSLALWLGR